MNNYFLANSFLASKVAVVTGGTSGIGRAAAITLAAAGAHIVVAGRRREEGDAVVGAISAVKGSAAFIETDVAIEADVMRMAAFAREKFGGIDIAINAAGTSGHAGFLADQSVENFDQVFAVNTRGLWFCLREEIKQMLAQGRGGAIVNISSASAFRGTRGGGPYSASKHAVEGLTKTAAVEYAPQNIRVNSIAPGPTRSAMLEGLFSEEQLRQIGSLRPMQRIGEAEEVAAVAVFLCSDAASYVTGETIRMDGAARHLPAIGLAVQK